MARFGGVKGHKFEGASRFTPDGPRWTGVVRLHEPDLELPLRWKKPRRIFVNSISDIFHEKVPDEWLDRIFAVMALAHWQTFQILTKRPDRMLAYFQGNPYDRILKQVDHLRYGTIMAHVERRIGVHGVSDPNIIPWRNVWLGVSCEDQATADERIPLLLQTPAAVRWVSYEPALGPVDFSHYLVYNPSHETNHERGNSLQSGRAGGAGDRQRGSDMARSSASRDKVGIGGSGDSLRETPSREQDGEDLPSGPRDGGLGENALHGASSSLASFQRSHPAGPDYQPQERQERRQPSREPGIGDIQRTTDSCDTNPESRPRLQPEWREKLHGETDRGDGQRDSSAQTRGGESDSNSKGLRDSDADGFENRAPGPLVGISWCVIGGESGPGARPFSISWARRAISQCQAAGVPVFLKQVGRNPYDWSGIGDAGVGVKRTLDPKGGDPSEWPAELRVRDFPGVKEPAR